jgi:hypothetical protein
MFGFINNSKYSESIMKIFGNYDNYTYQRWITHLLSEIVE